MWSRDSERPGLAPANGSSASISSSAGGLNLNGSTNSSTSSFFPANPGASLSTNNLQPAVSPVPTRVGSSVSSAAACNTNSQLNHKRMMSGSSSSSSSLFDTPAITLDPINAQDPQNTTTSSITNPTNNVRNRSRAGTLPSRLSPGLIGINRFGGAAPGASTPASISGTNMSFSPFESPNLGPIGTSTGTNTNTNISTGSDFLQSSSSRPMRQSLQPYTDSTNRLSIDLDDFQLARSKSNSSNLEAASKGSRLRSGSLNMPSETRPTFSPFGPSIWASPSPSQPPVNEPHGQPAHLQLPPGQAHQNQIQNHQHQHQPSLHASPANPNDDPMKPFLNELSSRTDVSRLRSYTVNTLPYSITDEEAELIYAQQQYQKQAQLQSQSFQAQNAAQNAAQNIPSAQHLYSSSSMPGSRQRAATVASPALDMQYRYMNQRTSPSMAPVSGPGPMGSTNQSPQLPADPHQHQNQNQNHSPQSDPTEEPTRSLWLGKLPPNCPVQRLQAIFASYGPVESVRILSNKNCGFVNFSATEYAIKARTALNGKELFHNMGPCRVGFAKVMDSAMNNGNSMDESLNSQYSTLGSVSGGNGPDNYHHHSQAIVSTVPPTLQQVDTDLLAIARTLEAPPEEIEVSVKMIDRAKSRSYSEEIGPIPELRPERVYDAPLLREIRKKIDTGVFTVEDTENFALDFLDDVAAFSSDYVGNTVVQKLFEICSEPVKDMMLKRIAPHLAAIGIHKNGTWAAQKIIDVCRTSRQTRLISEALRPFTQQLFLDQFGNYVIQCCLKFGSPWNDFIFEAMIADFIPISQGRFGARAMRACLESQFASVAQKRLLAAAIIVYVVPLTMNTNGALLITWLLDTCTFNHRHQALAPLLASQLVALATHKLASLTLLKVVHNGDESSSQMILQGLFGEHAEQTGALEAILKDDHHGPTFIYKVLSTTSLVEGVNRQRAIAKIRAILGSINTNANIGVYRRLMEEVGLVQPQILAGNPNASSPRYDSSVQQGQGQGPSPMKNRRQARTQGPPIPNQVPHQMPNQANNQMQMPSGYYEQGSYNDLRVGLENLSLGNPGNPANTGNQRIPPQMMYAAPQQYSNMSYNGNYYLANSDAGQGGAAAYPNYGVPAVAQSYVSTPLQNYNVQGGAKHMPYYERQE